MEQLTIRVLLVEDNPADVLFLREALEHDALAAYELTVVESLAEALGSLKEQKFEAILLDLGLPDSQGLPTFLQLQQAAPELPVVVLSALDNEAVAQQALQAGAQDYLVKRPQEIAVAARAVRYAIERQRSQAILRESEERFSTAFRISPMAQSIISVEDRILAVNDACCRLFGYDHEELLGVSPGQLNLWANPAEQLAALEEIQRTGRLQPMEVIIRAKSGALANVIFALEPITWQGQPCFLSSVIDITERKRAEEKLRESEKRFATLFRSNPVPVGITRASDYRIVDVNDAWSALTGYAREEALGHTSTELGLATPETLQHIRDLLQTQGEIRQHEISLRARSSQERQILVTAEPLELGGEIYMLNNLLDITERKQAEMALVEKVKLQEQLEKTAEVTPGLLCAFKQDAAGQASMPYASPAIEDVYGLQAVDLAQDMTPLFARIEGLDLPHVQATIAESARSMTPWHDEFIYHHPRKGPRWIEGHSSPVREADGSLIWYGIIQDITERKQAQVALAESEQRLRLALETTSDGFWIVDTERRFRDVNPAYCTMSGYTRQELLQLSISDVEVLESLEETQARIQKVQKQGRDRFETKHRRKDGSLFDVEVSVNVLDVAAGQIICFCRDITERKRADEKLRESEQFLSESQRIGHMGSWRWHLLTNQVEWSENCYKLYGYEPFEIDPSFEFFQRALHPEDLRMAQKVFEGLSQNPESTNQEFRIFDKNGVMKWIYNSMTPLVEEGQVVQLMGVQIDITERKQAEFALRESEEKYRQLSIELEERVQQRTAEIEAVRQRLALATQAASLGVWDWDIKTGQLYWDDQMYAIYGLSKDTFQVNMESFLSIVHPEDLPNLLNSTREALAGEPFGDVEFRIVRGDLTLGHVKVHGVIRRDAAGQAEDVIGVVQDITQERLAEQALRASEAQLRLSRDKLSAANAALEKAARMKDEFLASMSHELRTPLTGILGLSEALQLNTYGSLTEKQARALKNIEDSGRHLLSLINDILDLSKIEAGMFELNIEPVSLAEICQASLQLTKGLAQKKRQTVDFSMSPASIHLLSDARRLKQMLVNLLSNAIKFTPVNGSLGLEIETDEAEQIVKLTVWDKGIGIAPENIEKLFQPFVQLESSLARQYEGTGLGLSLVQRLVELHGGSVQVESTLGMGSRFTIRLPWSAQVTPASLNAPSEARFLQKVLIVDDSEIDAGQLSRYLRILGLETILHTVGQGVVEVAAREQPGAILLDLNLPGQHGFEVLAKLKADPATSGIPVVICSVEERRSQALAQGAVGYLVKPLTITDLRNELTRVSAALKLGPDAAPDPASSQPLILVVDDNELIIETISDFLVSQQFRVVAARSGMELLEVVPDLHPDLILVDIQMPIMDGLEATRRIRAHPDPLVSNVPIIALTALAMTGDRERCLAAGTTAYMSKPVGLKTLTETIRNLLVEKK